MLPIRQPAVRMKHQACVSVRHRWLHDALAQLTPPALEVSEAGEQYKYVFREQFVRNFVLVEHVVVHAGAGEGGAE